MIHLDLCEEAVRVQAAFPLSAHDPVRHGMTICVTPPDQQRATTGTGSPGQGWALGKHLLRLASQST